MIIRRIGVPVVGAVLMLAIVGFGQQLPVRPATPDQATVDTATATRVCPTSTSEDGTTAVAIDTVAAPPDSRMVVLRDDRTELGQVGPGQLRTIEVSTDATLVRSEAGAAGLAGQAAVAQASSGSHRGLMVSDCSPVTTESWFVGLRATDAERSTLQLTNPDLEPAEVSLRVHTADGLDPLPGTTGIAVAPGETRSVPLEGLLNTEDPLAIQVQSTDGRVAAVAEVEAGSGSDPAGADWASAAALPAPTVVVPGVPGGAGSRELVVVNPSEERVQARVELLGADGAFPPVDADLIDLGPGAVGAVELEPAMAGEALGVRVHADVPVTASVVARSSGEGTDVAFAPATAEQESFGLAAAAGWDEVPGTLIVSNPSDEPSTFTWAAFGSEAEPVGGDDVELPGSGTVAVELPTAGLVSVHLRPSEGNPVHAGVVLAGQVDTVAQLSTVPVTVGEVARGDRPTFDPQVGR